MTDSSSEKSPASTPPSGEKASKEKAPDPSGDPEVTAPPDSGRGAGEAPDEAPAKEAEKGAGADSAAAAAKKAPPKKPAAKKGAAKVDPADLRRRKFVWTSMTFALLASLAATIKFFFPRVLFEPRTRFPIGFPNDYSFGVDTKWQQAKRIWIVKQPGKMFVIFARCTHLGCTPDWKPAENKFKCPCHGSGFDMEGVNFEGPAPQPLLRTAISQNARGEIIVDKGRLFPVDSWNDPDSFLVV